MRSLVREWELRHRQGAPGDWDAVLVVPVGFNAASPAAALLANRGEIKKRHGGDLFVAMEDDGEVIDHYVRSRSRGS